MNPLRIAIVGGGAAGFFAAIHAKTTNPTAHVSILEKSNKFLAKVKISGGGRCNVTNATFDNKQLSQNYPRGEHFLRKAFSQFDAQSMVDWLESRGIALKTYPDNCIFPLANNSQVIIDCFMREANELGIQLRPQSAVKALFKKEDGTFEMTINEDKEIYDRVIITIGGQPKTSGFAWLQALDLPLIEPVPSLFTFNMPGNPVAEMMGNVVKQVSVRLAGTKIIGKGPLLITHWGMSGPAILQVSAWGARVLAEKKYQFEILVNWLDDLTDLEFSEKIERWILEGGNKKLDNYNPTLLTNKLWNFVLKKNKINPELRWNQLDFKNKQRFVEALLRDNYPVSGKTTFKEEFVTAGGVDLRAVDPRTMEIKQVAGLFVAGEAMDIDGITGGFNFQAAWTTGYIAGIHSAKCN